jgi:putative transposase
MMLDRDIVAVSPTSTYRILSQAGLLARWNTKPSAKGRGFVQPLQPHEHWHVDISYLNIAGTFFYLCSVLDGCSRALLHWQVRHSMTEAEVEITIQAAVEKYSGVKARVITDNGPQFVARDFKEFIRIAGLTHVKTSPYYPESNGKIERWAPNPQSRLPTPWLPTLDRRCTVPDRALCDPLQHHALALGYWVYHPS